MIWCSRGTRRRKSCRWRHKHGGANGRRADPAPVCSIIVEAHRCTRRSASWPWSIDSTRHCLAASVLFLLTTPLWSLQPHRGQWKSLLETLILTPLRPPSASLSLSLSSPLLRLRPYSREHREISARINVT